MDISSSERIRSESKPRLVMPVDIFIAAIEGSIDALITRLRLEPKEQTESQVTKEASDFDFEPISEIRDYETLQFELIQSATDFGDTLLHILITKRHNELALNVFEREMSLLLAQNKMLETPLHCAAKVGNLEVIRNLIESGPDFVVKALEKTNKNGEIALQIAAKYGYEGSVGCELLDFGLRESREMKNKRLSLLNMAIVEGYTSMVKKMLEIVPSLAYAQFPDGTFPIHVATRKGKMSLVRYFTKEYPHCVELLDPHGRNIFHIAVEENHKDLFHIAAEENHEYHFHLCSVENHKDLFRDIVIGERATLLEMMNNATDYKGNTPLHIAAMKGHRSIMRTIWENNCSAETDPNKEGLTPFDLSARQLKVTEDIDLLTNIEKYIETEGNRFTLKWFVEVMEPPPAPLLFENIWETAQFIGLGSVLITTVTFAAAFTIPGGHNQDHGTPVLGRKYAFRAFILANFLAFIQGFVSLITIIANSFKLGRGGIIFASNLMGHAANYMVVAFGLGLYVMLAPVCLPIAILLLVISLIFGSPAKLLIVITGQKYCLKMTYSIINSKKMACVMRNLVCSQVAVYAVCSVFIFCLALL